MSKRNNRETTFRFPFDIDTRYFLALALVFFVLSIKPINHAILGYPTINSLHAEIERDVNSKLKSFDKRTNEPAFVKATFDHTLTDSQFVVWHSLNYGVYFFDHQQMVFWNTISNELPPDSIPDGVLLPYKDSNGYYVLFKKQIGSPNDSRSVVAMFNF